MDARGAARGHPGRAPRGGGRWGGGGGRGWRGGGAHGGAPARGRGRGGSYHPPAHQHHKRPLPAPAAGSSHRQWKRVRTEETVALPVAEHRGAIVEAVRTSRVVVISGDTGCGKSTQVPQYLLDAEPAALIACTQPRRIAAKTLAQRVARERCTPVGHEIGYAISREHAAKRGTTRCTFLTVGLLLQMLIFDRKRRSAPPQPPPPQQPAAAGAEEAAGPSGACAEEDAELRGGLPYTHIVVDEAHERDIDIDLLLLLLRRLVHRAAAASGEAEEGDEEEGVEADGAEAERADAPMPDADGAAAGAPAAGAPASAAVCAAASADVAMT